eukprot:GHVS01051467.1.p1 GENE.GHVS01051467.1~~GHVS01051467.1.p1  ORF type:complete len:705 (+),score=192.78 GHVS01051467.1:273-2387(+)
MATSPLSSRRHVTISPPPTSTSSSTNGSSTRASGGGGGGEAATAPPPVVAAVAGGASSESCGTASYQCVPFCPIWQWLLSRSQCIAKVAFADGGIINSPTLGSLLILFYNFVSSFRLRLFIFFFGPIDEQCTLVASLVQQLRQQEEGQQSTARHRPPTAAGGSPRTGCTTTASTSQEQEAAAAHTSQDEEVGGLRRRRGRVGGEAVEDQKKETSSSRGYSSSSSSSVGVDDCCCEGAIQFSPFVSSFVERHYNVSLPKPSSSSSTSTTSSCCCSVAQPCTPPSQPCSTVDGSSTVQTTAQTTAQNTAQNTVQNTVQNTLQTTVRNTVQNTRRRGRLEEERRKQLEEVVKFLHEEGEDVILALSGEDEGFDQLNNLVENNPTKALWFIRAFMLFGAVMGLLLSVPVFWFLRSRWATSTTDNPLLAAWALTNCILQVLQVPLRLAFFARLVAVRADDRAGIIFAIRGITKSSAWWLSRLLSNLSYLWVIVGMVWVCSLLFLYITSPCFHHIDTTTVALSSAGDQQVDQQPATAYTSSPKMTNNDFSFPATTTTAAPRLRDVAMSVLLLSVFRFVITLASFVHFFPQTVNGELDHHRHRQDGGEEFLDRRSRVRKGAAAMCQLPRLTVGGLATWQKQRAVLRLQSDGCSICLHDFCPGDELRLLRCRHSFHQTCIDRWLLLNCCCPLCWCSASVPAVAADCKATDYY